jgi:Zn-dependent protease with chaperone function
VSEPVVEFGVGERKKFPGIASRAWEHPADRAALAALRRAPAVETAVRKLLGAVGERSVRLLFLGNAVKLGPRQAPRIYRLFEEACEILDVQPPYPELFVTQAPVVNAGTIGFDRPFVVLNSALVQLGGTAEVQLVLAHELGHVLSGHGLYKTTLALLLRLSRSVLGAIPLGGVALAGITIAFLEWDRKSELSADRAALLVSQQPRLAYQALMKLAGGLPDSDLSLDEFLAQAEEFEAGGSAFDSVLKLLGLMGQRHPFAALRAAELKRWVEGGEYARLLGGDHPRRGQAGEPVAVEAERAAREYRERHAEAEDPVGRAIAGIASAAESALGYLRNRIQKP